MYNLNPEDKQNMFEIFKDLGINALAMNHYDLEVCALSNYNATMWKAFLSEQDVKDYIKNEMEIIRTSQINKIVQNSSDEKSVARAQLLSTLQKAGGDEEKAEGPVFIYCYVPLNDEQRFAPNIMEVDKDGKSLL